MSTENQTMEEAPVDTVIDEELFTELDEEESIVLPEEGPAETPVAEEPAKEPVATPVVATDTTPQVETPPSQPTTESPTVPSRPSELTTEEVLANRKKIEDTLASRYVISEEDQADLMHDPQKVLSRLAAQVTLNAYEAAFQAIYSQLPALMGSFNQQIQAGRQAEEAFYSQWPNLRKPEYEATIREIAATYRQMFPRAAREEAMQQIGLIASAKLGVLPTAPPPQPAVKRTYKPAAPASVGLPGSNTLSEEEKFYLDLIQDN